jgi:hemolysin activation/secretion protein
MTVHIKRKCIALILFAIVYLAGGLLSLAFAIDIPRVEGAITNVSDPGLVQKRLGGETNASTPVLPTAQIVEQEHPSPDSPLEKIKFKLTKVIIKGNTVYTDAQLQTIFQPSINKIISLGDLQRLVKEVTKLYRREGYLLSRAIILPQVIKNGVITIQVVEGFISEVTVQGDTGLTAYQFNQYAKHLVQVRSFQSAVLERDMLLMNDMPGYSVKAVIRPSKVTSGGAELVLITERIKGQATISYDNFGTRFIGPQQITLSGSLYSAAFPGDNNTLTYITVPDPEELKLIQFIHTHPIGINGWNFTLGGNYTATHPLFTLAPLDVYGRSFYAFTDLSHNILRTRTANIFVHGAFNYQNVTSTILGQLFYADRYRSLVLGGNADGIDRWNGINTVGLDLEQGFDILGAGKHFLQSRPLGVSNFTKVNVNASHLQWFTQRFSILGAMQGQYSFNPLLAAEQFSYGGPEFGRGYDPSQIVGDDGIGAKIELRLNTNPDWAYLQVIQPYLFYDVGKIWNRDGISLPAVQSATSTGIGARFIFLPQLTGNFYIAKPLTLPVAALQAMGEDGHAIRTFFQLSATV